MQPLNREQYFYSIEPFWRSLQVSNIRRSPADDCRMMNASHGTQTISCVPGNGQIGMIL